MRKWLPEGWGWMVTWEVWLCRQRDPNLVAKDGSKNGCLELPEGSMEVLEKRAYI
jgi:hypothetical protein